MRKLILFLIVCLPLISWADDICVDPATNPLSELEKVAGAVTADDECPNARPLRGICNHVIEPDNYDGESSHTVKLKQAACVSKGDSPEIEGKKVREMWSKYEDKLVCDTISFSITGGNIIKATVMTENRDFLNTLVRWNVNFNRVDPADNRTVLDYIKDQLDKNPPQATKLFLQHYYNVLKKQGAKHKTEL